MLIKDLPKVPRPAKNGDWDFYDCVIFAEKMHELYPKIKRAIRSSNRSPIYTVNTNEEGSLK